MATQCSAGGAGTVQEHAWSTLDEYVEAVLTCPNPEGCTLHLDASDFEGAMEPHDIMASVAIMCVRRMWGDPDTWLLYNISPDLWRDFVTRFRCTGWDVCVASSGALPPCTGCSTRAPGLLLWQDADVPLGINVKKIDTPQNCMAGPLFLWCQPGRAG